MDLSSFVLEGSEHKNNDSKLTSPVNPFLPSTHLGHHSPNASSHKNGFKSRKLTNKGNGVDFLSHSYASFDELELMANNKEVKHNLKLDNSDVMMTIAIEGLQHPRAVAFLLLWYFFSAGTLFLNKYILTYLSFNPYLMCGLQMLITMMCGAVQMWYPMGCYKHGPKKKKPSNFYFNMIILGLLQLGTILFGLVALYYVAVSFAETVKSSAPLVTVFLTWLLRGERTSCLVLLTLLPVMGGLAVCSSGEISFNFLGFLCALTTNVCEVLQSVLSKTVLSDASYDYNPAELQFYPNAVGVAVQAVGWLFLVSRSSLQQLTDPHLLVVMLLDGISFHGQTITAYVLMSYVSPVTYSVANTTKRAVLIWLSVLVFGNAITLSSGLGTVMVIAGVLLYSRAKQHDQTKRILFSVPSTQVDRHYK